MDTSKIEGDTTMRKFVNLRFSAAAVLPALLLTACAGGQGGSSASPEEKKPSTEPVELSFYYSGGNYGEQRFMETIGNPIMKKYPHISMKYYQTSKANGSEGLTLADAVATGVPIDVLYASLSNVSQSLQPFGLQYDHADLIKRNRFDLNSLVPQAVDSLKGLGGGALYGLPVAVGSLYLYYNKDLFDKFGVSYPQKGLTWDQLYDLTKKMARTEGGVKYRGLAIGWTYMATFNPMGAGLVDPATNKALFAKDEKWQKLVSNLIRFYNIPGNEVDAESAKWKNQFDEFTKGTAAMMLTANNLSRDWNGRVDVASFPVSPDKPGVGGGLIPNFFGVTSISKHKDEAFQAIAFLASKEYQLQQARIGSGSLPVIDDPQIRAEYSKDNAWMQERNINVSGWFPERFADAYTVTPYDGRANAAFVAEMEKLSAGTVADVNTALRQAAEAADKAIEAQISAGK
jgi:multiple sugar transport system substrate-binding protein